MSLELYYLSHRANGHLLAAKYIESRPGIFSTDIDYVEEGQGTCLRAPLFHVCLSQMRQDCLSMNKSILELHLGTLSGCSKSFGALWLYTEQLFNASLQTIK